RAVVDSVLHEQLHAYQHQKIVQGQQGALPPGSPLRELAPAWGYNMDHYVSATADSKAYAGQPLERHAFSNAARITQGLFAPSPRATPRGPAAPGACDPATPPAAIGSPVRGRSRFSLARQVARAR
ncbi:MAG: hypothetical protein VKP62_14615, partial [Candidatus Sericytochromatia bacterium]|nr:hypothetical protein [Candidatus Sericytochromatia bacterium]